MGGEGVDRNWVAAYICLINKSAHYWDNGTTYNFGSRLPILDITGGIHTGY